MGIDTRDGRLSFTCLTILFYVSVSNVTFVNNKTLIRDLGAFLLTLGRSFGRGRLLEKGSLLAKRHSRGSAY